MSGGSLDYSYMRVDNAIDMIQERASTYLHHEFVAHLRLVSKALHDLEWVWSCDYGPGDEDAAIKQVLGIDQPIPDAVP